jgi:hypothetical protein
MTARRSAMTLTAITVASVLVTARRRAAGMTGSVHDRGQGATADAMSTGKPVCQITHNHGAVEGQAPNGPTTPMMPGNEALKPAKTTRENR